MIGTSFICRLFFCLHAPDARFSSLPLSHSPVLLPHLTLFFLAPCFTSPWELNHGHASSTLRHFKDLTEQRPHHFSLSHSPSPFFLMVRRSSLDTALACLGSSSSRVLARSSCGGHGDSGGGCAGANNLLLAQKWSVEGTM